MMKKIILGVCFIFAFFAFEETSISAKEVISSDIIVDISGDAIGIIEIYDNSEIKISYKYGLRLAELYYCDEEVDCKINFYNKIIIAEASEDDWLKNEETGLKTFQYKPILKDGLKYKLKVNAYFGSTSNYTGTENVNTGFMLVGLEVSSKDVYVEGSSKSGISDEGLNNLMNDLSEIVNEVVLPVMYTVLGLFLVVKGAILGVQIVKNADHPDIRREKIGALKWLLIGSCIGVVASTVVGIITGFFENWL